jgi:predicted TIM-barrel fold metal-dependent hydrolase
MPIDMHAHWLPEAISDMLRARSTPPMIEKRADGGEDLVSMFRPVPAEEAIDTVDERIALMDRCGVGRGVLSLTPVMGVESAKIEDALPIARAVNDSASAACVAHPDRFAALATLPMADLKAATEEFERALNLPGIIGGLLPSDGFLSLQRAEKFRPLMDVAQRHGAVVMVHYGRLADDPDAPRPDLSDTKDLRIGTLDMQARLSSNMITFCMTDFLDDYPNVTVMSHNLGGNIPFEVERLDHRTLVDDPDSPLPSKAIRASRVIVDCNSLGASSIERAVDVYGAHRIVLGTDGTAFGMKWSHDAIAEAKISDADKQAILHGNAAAIVEPLLNKGARAAAE